MHIAGNMISGATCTVTATLAVFGLATAFLAARQAVDRPTSARFAAVTALVFAGQTIDFPVQDGVSGHLLGGVLASMLLGTPFGVLSMAIVVLAQTFVFGEGGLAALGANLLNMSLIAAGVGGMLADLFRSPGGRKSWGGILLAAWFSVILASLACAIEIGFSEPVGLVQLITGLVGVYALIGVGEALITVGVLLIVPERQRTTEDFRAILVPFGMALFGATVVTRFSSPAPNGLDWVMSKFESASTEASAYLAPLANSSVSQPGASTNDLAGLMGVVCVSVLAVAVSRIWRPKAMAAGS